MNDSITLTATTQETQLILSALARLPYEAVAPLIGRLQAEAQSQLDARAVTQPSAGLSE